MSRNYIPDLPCRWSIPVCTDAPDEDLAWDGDAEYGALLARAGMVGNDLDDPVSTLAWMYEEVLEERARRAGTNPDEEVGVDAYFTQLTRLRNGAEGGGPE